MIGAHHGAREVVQLAAASQWRAERIKTTPPAQRSVIDAITLFLLSDLVWIGDCARVCGTRRSHTA
jgi:hypothetical protein